MESPRSLVAELLGTFWLVLGGCGTAVLAGSVMGTLGISIAFGLTVLTGVYFLGHISGGHFNPAVTVGLLVGRKFEPKNAIGYIVAQLIGAILAAVVILIVANGVDGFSASESGFAANGFDDQSPGGYSLLAAAVIEIVLTAMFLLVILGVTGKDATPGFAGLSIGLCLALIHLISIPVTNTSVNPARSTSQALFAGSDYLSQLLLFWLAPVAGAALGAYIHTVLLDKDTAVID
ncbi:MAG: aquaporin Z [Ilumatobacteraceae bacterium]